MTASSLLPSPSVQVVRAHTAQRYAFESADSAAFAVAADAWEEAGRTETARRVRADAELVDILSRHGLATPALIGELSHVRHVCRTVMSLNVRRLTARLKRERRATELRSRLLVVPRLAALAPAAGDLIDWYMEKARPGEAASRRQAIEETTEATSRRRVAEAVSE